MTLMGAGGGGVGGVGDARGVPGVTPYGGGPRRADCRSVTDGVWSCGARGDVGHTADAFTFPASLVSSHFEHQFPGRMMKKGQGGCHVVQPSASKQPGPAPPRHAAGCVVF